MQGAVDRDAKRCPAAICRTAASPRGSRELRAAIRRFPPDVVRGVRAPPRHARARGAAATRRRRGDLGEDFGAGLTAREIDYFVADEWARSAEDVLWRRTQVRAAAMTRARRAQRVAAATWRDAMPAAARARASTPMRPLAEMPRAMRARDPRRADRHRRHADDARPAHRATPTRRSSGCSARASSWSRSPAGPPAGATTSRACGRSTPWSARTARSTCATTRDARKLVQRFVVDDADARARNRARLAAIGERILRAVPGCRARVRPALPRGRPRDRFLRGRAAAAARGGRPHRRADGSRRPDGQGELDPRQRLVRRATTSSTMTRTAARRGFRHRPRRRARALRLRRRLAERRADVRLLPERGRRGQRARVRATGSPTLPAYVTAARRRRGIRGARGLSARLLTSGTRTRNTRAAVGTHFCVACGLPSPRFQDRPCVSLPRPPRCC